LKESKRAIEDVAKEINILTELDHENIIKIYNYSDVGIIKKPSGSIRSNIVFLALEFASGGLLFEVCETLGGLGEEMSRVFIKEILSGLAYMQDKGISHRDLKLENILVTSDYKIKIADFGFATTNRDFCQTYGGTQIYMAPEVSEGKQYSAEKADVFSLGVIIYVLTKGTFPFADSKKEDEYY
jgi:serine kinase